MSCVLEPSDNDLELWLRLNSGVKKYIAKWEHVDSFFFLLYLQINNSERKYYMREIETERQRDADRQTDGRTDRERHTDRQTDKETDIQRERETDSVHEFKHGNRYM